MKKITLLAVLASCSTPATTGPTSDNPDAPGTTSANDASTTTDDSPSSTVDAGFVAPPANDRCTGAISLDMSPMHSDIAATTAGATADLAAPCGASSKPDVFYKFTLTRRQLVYADTFGSTSATSLYFASSCTTPIASSTTAGDAVCSEGACGTSQSQVVALLDPGTYYLVLAGNGAATLHFQHIEVGNGSVSSLAKGASTTSGTTSGSGDLYQCDAGGPENAYWWKTCPSDPGGTFTGSTCGGTTFDTIVSLQIASTEAVMCDDDTCSFQSTVSAAIPAGAGLYSMAVDGFSPAQHGTYTLTASRP